MASETRTCQNCKQDFTIEPEDFEFYAKIKMPAPTWCVDCRTMRRMMWRNERTLYKRPCNAPGHTEELISIYAPEKPFVIYDQKYWWGDQWDPLDYGREYDFSKPFFTQFRELMEKVPFLSLSNSNAINSDYCNVADQSKDSYLGSASYKIERVMYSNRIFNSKDSVDIYVGSNCELCYDCISCWNAYKLFYSKDSTDCSESYFLYDCKNCSNCVGCANLRNKSYCIFNEQLTKEEYEKKFQELKLDTREGLAKAAEKFEKIYLDSIHRFARIFKSIDTTGDSVENSKNCHYVFDIMEGLEDSKYCFWGGLKSKDIYDGGPGIGDAAELIYDATDTGLQSSNVAFTNVVYGSNQIRYCLYSHNGKNLFGCIGLRNKQYCILNKQYTKEEYEQILPRIIEQMNSLPYVDAAGRSYGYGEFFPPEISPMAYNESIAQDYFPSDENAAKKSNLPWRTETKKENSPTIKAENLPQSIAETPDTITKEMIGCSHNSQCNDGCSGAFRITPQELDFYKKLNIPLPQLCFSCRHMRRLKRRNPMKLWHRQCLCDYQRHQNSVKHNHHPEGRCPNEFETPYAPERPETIYCETCYQAEII